MVSPHYSLAGTMSNVTITASNYAAGATATYTVGFTTATNVGATPEIVFRIVFSNANGFTVNTALSDLAVTVNGTPATVDISSGFPSYIGGSGEIVVRINQAVTAGSNVVVTIPNVVNGSTGTKSFAVFYTANSGGNPIDSPASTPSVTIVTGYTLSYSAGSNGTVSGTATQILASGGNGTAVTAVPNGGYRFDGWSDGSTANPRTDTNISGNVTVTANFSRRGHAHYGRIVYPVVYTTLPPAPTSITPVESVTTQPTSTPVATPTQSPTTEKPAPYQFTRSLRLGQSGDDVMMLQKFLNTHGAPIATSGRGSLGNETTLFGPLTQKALIRYQEANAGAILTPQGFTRGTGVFGSETMKFINNILSK